MKGPLPPDEEDRLKALRRYEILDTRPDQEFDDIALLASLICGTPIAMISLIDENRQWFKSRIGITESETAREIAFCAYGILQSDVFVIEDVQSDERFAGNPMVTGSPRIRFYAGAPLITSDGHALGMLCVNDLVPRKVSKDQMAALRALSRQVVAQLELKRSLGELRRTSTERKQAAEDLGASELQYRRLFETAKDGILILDAETGMVVDVNPFLTTLLGFSHEEFLGKAIWDLGFFEDIVANECNFAELREKEYLRYEDMPLKTIDGRQIDVEFVSNVYRVNEGKVIQCNVRDITERKRTEKALKNSGLRYHSLFENMLEGYAYCRILLDQNRVQDFVYLETNRAFEELTGLKDVVGRRVSEVIPGIQESNPELIEIYGRVALTGHAEKYETYVESLGIWFSISVYSQEREHFVAIFENITDRKQAEEELRESKRFVESITENSTSLIYLFDLETGSLAYSNRSLAQFLGYSDAQVRGLGDNLLLSIMHPEDLPRVAKRHAHYAEVPDSRVFDFEYRVKDASGNWRWLWGREKVFSRRSNGAAWQLMGTAQDITERKQAQHALSLALERLQLAVKAGKAGTWEFDLQSGEVDWDDQMLALYGKNSGNVEHGVDRWYHSMLPEDLAKSQAVYEETLREQKDAFDTEFRIHRVDDGTLHYIRGSGIVLRDIDGQAVRMTGINWDITEERVREATLAAALIKEKEFSDQARAGERAKSEFLAVMSHEIRTPLNGILGFSELLAQTPNLPLESRDYAQIIISSGEALLRILDDILDFSRLEAERLPIERTRFSPREVLEDIRILLAQQARSKELAFDVLIDETIPKYLEADAGRIRQILLNLCGNAIKFTEHGCVILGLRLAPTAGNYEFYVKDTGPGIALKQQQRIFEPFIQADSSITRCFGGTGLGLSISRRLAELMGGKLEVRSRPGEGSEFVVSIPVNVAESSFDGMSGIPPTRLDTNFASQHPLLILVVEDDNVNLKLILLLIRKLGYQPLAAKNGREAVEINESERPDCIFMDLQMPEMGGIEATEKIRAQEKTTRSNKPTFISALTANIFPADRQRCLEVGMNSYLNKPVKLTDLATILSKVADWVAR